VEEVIGEVKTVKSTIKQFIELIRQIFNAEVCYLYLVNKDMDNDEKKQYFAERIGDIEKSYKKNNKEFHKEEFEKCDIKDIKILKFIDIVEGGEKKNGYIIIKTDPESM